MLEPFVLRAAAAGVAIAIVAGFLGCFVVWRRMAYFGDSLAHSALLGIALGIATGAGVNLGVLVVCLAFAVTLTWLQRQRVLATDTLLGILAHAGLSIGLVALSVLKVRIDLHAFLFGDILTVTSSEIVLIAAGGLLILALLAANWQSLVLLTISEDLAQSEGVRTFAAQLLFVFLMTIAVAVSLRVVGILLITSFLIIPAATARQFARSPVSMAAIAALLGILAVLCGVSGSVRFDTPTGPSIVVASALLFAALFPFAAWAGRRGASRPGSGSAMAGR